jgi:hypothetical protein
VGPTISLEELRRISLEVLSWHLEDSSMRIGKRRRRDSVRRRAELSNTLLEHVLACGTTARRLFPSTT